MDDTNQLDLTELSAELVAAYVSNNRLSPHELPTLITQVHGAFASLSNGKSQVVEEQPFAKPTPSQIRKSITPDALISFVDGKPYKTLKRHLNRHGMSSGDYRAKYSLPNDYPSVAPNYSATRSALAKSLGLGNRGYLADKVDAPAVASTVAPKKTKRASRPR